MEAWRRVFREGYAPLLTTEELQATRLGLQLDDWRLIQGATTTPPPLQSVQDWPVESCCLVAYPFVALNGGFAREYKDSSIQRTGAATVGDTEIAFAKMCYEIDLRLCEPAGCRYMLNFFDETPREEMRKLFLEEVEQAIKERSDGQTA